MRTEAAGAIRNVFNAPDRTEASRQLKLLLDRYREKAPKLSAASEANIPEGLTVFQLPVSPKNGYERPMVWSA